MSKQKPQPIEIKVFTKNELVLGIRKLERRLAELKAIDPAKVSYNDPIIDRIESDIRATVLEVFGSKSPEYDEHKYFSINQGPFYADETDQETQLHFQEEYPRAVELITGLIKRLREKQEDLESIVSETPTTMSRSNTKKVFIVHGRDEELKSIIARFIEKLELEAIILSEQPSQGKTIIEKFETNSDVFSAVILLSPDDIGCLQTEYQANPANLKPRARQNALIELGYFIGKLGRKNVFAVCKGELELPSDLHGIIYIPFDNTEGWKLKIAKELKSAGLSVDMNKVI